MKSRSLDVDMRDLSARTRNSARAEHAGISMSSLMVRNRPFHRWRESERTRRMVIPAGADPNQTAEIRRLADRSPVTEARDGQPLAT